MGVFDVPAPAFAWLDGVLSELTAPTARLILWGALSGALSMALYWVFSRQGEIASIKQKAAEARRALDSYEGDFSGAWPIMRDMLRLSLRQIGLVTWPAVVASLPVLFVIVWLSNAYGYAWPAPNMEIPVRISPPQLHARWIEGESIQGGSKTPRIIVTDESDRVVGEVAMTAPVPVIHKREWWNSLFANPAGYLPDGSLLERIEVDLPRKQYIGFGPWWLRTWEALYFAVLIACSLAIKVGLRIA